MHYLIADSLVESELAAKSTKQTNKYMLNYIYHLSNTSLVLDYGCGKLRYTIHLAKKVSKVIAIDSLFQLDKKQVIDGIYTTVRLYTNDYLNNTSIFDVNSDAWQQIRYDIVFCINVLSAVPNDEDRLKILRNARSVLSKNGYIFISVQYRNSYFSDYNKRANVKTYNDGWLIQRKGRSYSFYGILSEEKLNNLCDQSGLSIRKIKKHDGSIFIEAISCN